MCWVADAYSDINTQALKPPVDSAATSGGPPVEQVGQENFFPCKSYSASICECAWACLCIHVLQVKRAKKRKALATNPEQESESRGHVFVSTTNSI